MTDIDELIDRLEKHGRRWKVGDGQSEQRARDCDRAADAIKDAQKRIAELEAALGFYANNDNWRDGSFECSEPGVVELVSDSVSEDHGETARAALNNTGKDHPMTPQETQEGT